MQNFPVTASGGISRLQGPDGLPVSALADLVQLRFWNPDVLYPEIDPDVTFAPVPTSEAQVMADGGLLNGNQGLYLSRQFAPWSSATGYGRALLQPGPAGAAGPQAFQIVTPNGVPMYPIDGVISPSGFTAVWFFYPYGTTNHLADVAASWSSSHNAFWQINAGGGVSVAQTIIATASATQMTCSVGGLAASVNLISKGQGTAAPSTSQSTMSVTLVSGAAPVLGAMIREAPGQTACIPPGTYITAVSGTGPYTVTLGNVAGSLNPFAAPGTVTFNWSDGPPQAWACAWMTYTVTGSNGQITCGFGNNYNTATGSSGANPLTGPLGGDPTFKAGAGLAVGATGWTPTADGGCYFTAPRIFANTRTYGTTKQVSRPKIAVDAGASLGAFPTGVMGVVQKHSSWAWTEAFENADPTLPARTVQIQTHASQGCPNYRIGDFHLRAVPTVRAWAGTATLGSPSNTFSLTLTTGATPQVGDVVAGNGMPQPATVQAVSGTGPYTVQVSVTVPSGTTVAIGGGANTITYTDLDALLDRLWTAHGGTAGQALTGGPQFHHHIGYTPAAYGGSSSYHQYPAVTGLGQDAAFALHADWGTKTIQHMNTRYPGALVSLSFWNEPEGAWTSANPAGARNSTFRALWLAHALAINTANVQSNSTQLFLGGPDNGYTTGGAPGADDTSAGGYVRGCLATAFANSLPFPSQPTHMDGYGDESAIAQRVSSIQADIASAGYTGGPPSWKAIPKVRITEHNYIWGSGPYSSQSVMGTSAGANLPQRVGPEGVHSAALNLAAVIQMIASGVDMAHYYRQWQPPPGGDNGNMYIGLGNNGPSGGSLPRIWPLGALYEWLWKLTGNRATVTTVGPHLKALASINGNTVTLVGGSWRPWNPTQVKRIQFEFANLPGGWTTWKLWRMDLRDLTDGRPQLVSQGSTTNLPYGIDLTAVGTFCLQLT